MEEMEEGEGQLERLRDPRPEVREALEKLSGILPGSSADYLRELKGEWPR